MSFDWENAKDLEALRDAAEELSRDPLMGVWWQRAYANLADAAHTLCAMYAAREFANKEKE